jgi:hypothetical protein
MKIWYTLLFLVCSISIWAQNEETLIKNIEVIGAFGGPLIEVGSINGEFGADVGGGGALVINNFFIGGYGLGTDYPQITIDNEDYNIRFKHGGFWLGYTSDAQKLLHFYSSARLGWGKTQIRGDGPAVASDRVFVLTPEVGFEVNLTNFMRVAFTGGYRVVTGVSKLGDFANDDFSSPIGAITFRFGGFSNDWGDFDWDW